MEVGYPSMSEDTLESVLESVQDWTDSTSDSIHQSGAQTALVVSCSMNGCEHREQLWPTDASWNAVGVQTLGNRTWEQYGGETVLDSNIAHLKTQYDITAILVLGHTRCAVLEDAYEQWVGPATELSAGIKRRLGPLVSLAGDGFEEGGFEEGVFEESMPLRRRQYRFVEYNVVQQVAFLQRVLPASITVAGYVHDQDGAYSSFPDERYLVALDGEADPTEIRTRLPEDAGVEVASLLN